MTSTLDFYWDLASLDSEKRLEAATGLISALCKFQSERAAGGSSTEQALSEEDLDRICASDVSYAVKRLVKGLASPRDGARQGYSMALSELLARVDCISVKVVLDLLWKYTSATKSMKGQEQRDMRFGRIFGLMALLQSGILTRRGTGAAEVRKIVTELAAIGAKKSYLREIAYVTLTSIVPMLAGFEKRDELITMFVAVALDKGSIETPDELYLAVQLRQAFPEYDWRSALPQWHGKHMFAERNVGKLVSILCETSEENTGLFSSWHAQLHTVWDYVFDLYYNKERAAEVEAGRVMDFETLWERVVERGLFAAGASQFRRYWGFLLVERLLPHLSESTVAGMMSPNIVRALSDNIAVGQKSALVKVSMRTAERLVEVCEKNSKVGLAVLTHLLNQKSTIQASGPKQTNLRSMMASRIVAKLDGEAIVGYVSYLKEIFLQPGAAHGRDGVADPVAAINVSDRSVERQRAWAVDQMIRVARFDQLAASEEVTRGVVGFVTAYAAFQNGGQAAGKPELTPATRDYCATAVVGLVGELSRSSSQAAAADGTLWATAAIAAVLEGSGQPQKQQAAAKRRPQAAAAAAVVLPGFSETRAVLAEALGVLRMLEARGREYGASEGPVAAGNAQRVRALGLLVGNVAVLAGFSVNPQARSEFGEAIGELVECSEKMVAQFEAAKSKKKIKAAAEEPRPVEVLTDLVISFLTKDSHALRKLCEQVFAPFTELVTAAAVDAIVGVLQAREGAGGAEGGGIDAQMEALDAMDVDDDEGEDGGEEAGAGAEEVDEEVDEELRRKIQEALGSAGQGVDDTEEFDDEQMTVFDDKLAEIFQHKKQARTAARDLRISFGNFKLRVLDLAEVFLSRQSDSGLAIRVIRAVVDLARATRRDARSKAIHDRAVAVLVARRSRTPVGASVDVAEAAALLAFVHESARRAADKAEQRGLGAAAAVATRALLDAGAGDAVAAQCAATVRDFMTRQASQIHVDFFRVAGAKLHGAQWAVVWHAAAAAVREFGRPRAALNVFRQVQAYALAEVAAGSAAALAADADADVVAGAAGALVGGVRSAVLAVAEEVAAGSAAIDRSRLREIIELALAVFRRCVRCDGAMRAAALQALAPDAAWAAAMPALAACDGVRASTTVVRLCATLGSVDEWAAAIKPAKKREQQ